MKNIIIIITLMSLISSCATVNQRHYFQKTDGTWVSKKEFDAFNKKIRKEFFESFTKEEIELFKGVSFGVDTSSKYVKPEIVNVKKDTFDFDRSKMVLYIIEGIPTWVDTTSSY